MQRRHALTRLATLAGASLVAGPAVFAQGKYPQRPITLVVPTAPGGSTDFTARLIVEPLSRALGQPVIVDNKPGASGNIAADLVAKASDDHTLGIVINGNLTSSKMLYARLPYDPAKDFTYLSLIATAPLVLVAQNNLPSGAEFLEAARKGGASWNYGSVGVGSVGHLGMELLKSRVPGFNAEHVPYAGNPQVVTAMLGNQVQMALVPPGIALPQARAGKLKTIGLTSGRSALAPEVAPLSEIGVRDFKLEVWTALLGPASLSRAAQARILRELAIIMKSPEVRQKLFDQGWQPVGTSPDGMRARVKEEAATMAQIISARGIRIE